MTGKTVKVEYASTSTFPTFRQLDTEHVPYNQRSAHRYEQCISEVAITDYDGSRMHPTPWTQINITEHTRVHDSRRGCTKTISVVLDAEGRAMLRDLLNRKEGPC